MSQPHFQPAMFDFLEDLEANNDREWFKAHRDRYDRHVKDAAVRFIQDFGPRLAKISGHFRADPRPVGGSLFRIHRDVRFSKDKSPYKTSVGIHFRHEVAKDAHAPGFYLHMHPRECFIGVGIWQPDGKSLGKIRQDLMERPDAWHAATRRPAFKRDFELAGSSLKRAPRGVDPDHPLIEDLKRKDFIAVSHLSPADVTEAAFLKRFSARCRNAAPFVAYLCGAVGVPF